MENVRVTATKYSEVGALTNEKEIVYFDNVEKAKNFYNEWNAKRYEEGNGKMYKMDLAVAGYVAVANPTDFFAQFGA